MDFLDPPQDCVVVGLFDLGFFERFFWVFWGVFWVVFFNIYIH